MIEQDQQLPPSFNREEKARKLEQERQMLELDRKVNHLIDIADQHTKLFESMVIRTGRLETTLFGIDFTNGIVQKVDTLTRLKTWMLCTASALASAALTILVSYAVKHI